MFLQSQLTGSIRESRKEKITLGQRQPTATAITGKRKKRSIQKGNTAAQKQSDNTRPNKR